MDSNLTSIWKTTVIFLIVAFACFAGMYYFVWNPGANDFEGTWKTNVNGVSETLIIVKVNDIKYDVFPEVHTNFGGKSWLMPPGDYDFIESLNALQKETHMDINGDNQTSLAEITVFNIEMTDDGKLYFPRGSHGITFEREK